MAQYKGAASEAGRAMQLRKKREKEREQLEQLKLRIAEVSAVSHVYFTLMWLFAVVRNEMNSTQKFRVSLGLGSLGRSIPEGGAIVALRRGPDVLFTCSIIINHQTNGKCINPCNFYRPMSLPLCINHLGNQLPLNMSDNHVCNLG